MPLHLRLVFIAHLRAHLSFLFYFFVGSSSLFDVVDVCGDGRDEMTPGILIEVVVPTEALVS
jgi:hypothetical protein